MNPRTIHFQAAAEAGGDSAGRSWGRCHQGWRLVSTWWPREHHLAPVAIAGSRLTAMTAGEQALRSRRERASHRHGKARPLASLSLVGFAEGFGRHCRGAATERPMAVVAAFQAAGPPGRGAAGEQLLGLHRRCWQTGGAQAFTSASTLKAESGAPVCSNGQIGEVFGR